MGSSSLTSVRFGNPRTDEGLETWRQFCAESFLGDLVWPLSKGPGFFGEYQRRWVDDCLIARFSVSPYAGRFFKSSAAGDYVGFGVSDAASTEAITMRNGGELFEIEGSVGVWDNGGISDFSFIAPKGQTYIFVPKAALKGAGFRMSDISTPIDVNHKPTARVLQGVLDSVLDAPTVLPRLEAVSIRNAVLDLLAGTTRDSALPVVGAVCDAMKQRVEEWVAAQVAHGPVSPVDAAAAHGISVRSLHRLFSDSGQTFGDMVRAMRLERARQDLALTNHTVQAIATRWGYADLSHFCREFKRAFGITTTEFRNEANAQAAVS